MLKISDFYLDKETCFIRKKYIKSTRPCTMDSSFFSQQMAPWRPNLPNPRLWTHYWHSFRWRQLGFVSTFTGYSTSSLVSVVLCSFFFSGSKYTLHNAVSTNAILVMYMHKWIFVQNYKFSNKNDLLCARRGYKKKYFWWM